MTYFDLIKTVEDIRSELQASTAYSNECITKQCDIGKEVWIKYYYGGTLEERHLRLMVRSVLAELLLLCYMLKMMINHTTYTSIMEY